MKYSKEDLIHQYEVVFSPVKSLSNGMIDMWKKHFMKMKNFNVKDFNKVVNRYK